MRLCDFGMADLTTPPLGLDTCFRTSLAGSFFFWLVFLATVAAVQAVAFSPWHVCLRDLLPLFDLHRD